MGINPSDFAQSEDLKSTSYEIARKQDLKEQQQAQEKFNRNRMWQQTFPKNNNHHHGNESGHRNHFGYKS